jgi:hypothetical protein
LFGARSAARFIEAQRLRIGTVADAAKMVQLRREDIAAEDTRRDSREPSYILKEARTTLVEWRFSLKRRPFLIPSLVSDPAAIYS